MVLDIGRAEWEPGPVVYAGGGGGGHLERSGNCLTFIIWLLKCEKVPLSQKSQCYTSARTYAFNNNNLKYY